MYTTPQFNRVRVAADADAGVGTLHAVLLSGIGGAATLKLYDATSASGDTVLEIAAVNGGSTFINLQEAGASIKFSTGMYADITGTGAFAVLWKG